MLAEILHDLIDAAGPQVSSNRRGELHALVGPAVEWLESLATPAAAPVKPPKQAAPVPSFTAPPAPAPDAA